MRKRGTFVVGLARKKYNARAVFTIERHWFAAYDELSFAVVKYRTKYASSARQELHTRPLPPTQSRKPCHTNANEHPKMWDWNHFDPRTPGIILDNPNEQKGVCFHPPLPTTPKRPAYKNESEPPFSPAASRWACTPLVTPSATGPASPPNVATGRTVTARMRANVVRAATNISRNREKFFGTTDLSRSSRRRGFVVLKAPRVLRSCETGNQPRGEKNVFSQTCSRVNMVEFCLS